MVKAAVRWKQHLCGDLTHRSNHVQSRIYKLCTYTFCFLGFFLGDAASPLAAVTFANKGVEGAVVMVPFISAVVCAAGVGVPSLDGSLLTLFGDTGAV